MILAAEAMIVAPSALEYALFAHVELAILLWLPFVWLLYKILPWAFGEETAEPWAGRRRLKMLLACVGAGVAVFTGLFLLNAVTHASADFWRINVVSFATWYFDSDFTKNDFQVRVLAFALMELPVTLIVLMAVKLHGKWIAGRSSDAERTGGPRGFVAWLAGPNLLWAAAMILLTGLAAGVLSHGPGSRFDEDAAMSAAVVTLFLTLGLLAAYPIGKTFGTPDAATAGSAAAVSPAFAAAGADLSSERQRVLRLLEDGRVTADEASELISSLAATVSPSVAAGAPLSRSRKLAMAGAFVVLIGFFLPWFRLNPVDEARKMFNLPIDSATATPYVPNNTVWTEFSPRLQIAGSPVTAMPVLQGSMITITGGDVGRGLGWLVLAGALVGAATPAIAGLSIAGQRNLAWLAVGVTSIVTLHLLISSFSWASYGLLFVLLGLGLQWAGLVLELPKRPMSQPVL